MSTSKSQSQSQSRSVRAAAGDCPWLDAGPGAEPLELDDYPISMIARVASRVQQEITRVYAREHGLTPPEWRLIARLAKSAPVQLSMLCRVTGVDKAQAGRVLRGLERRGLVVMRGDEHHGRRIVVHITPEGQALARALFPIAERAQMALLEVLTPAEKQALYSGLKKLLKTAGKPSLRAVKETEK